MAGISSGMSASEDASNFAPRKIAVATAVAGRLAVELRRRRIAGNATNAGASIARAVCLWLPVFLPVWRGFCDAMLGGRLVVRPGQRLDASLLMARRLAARAALGRLAGDPLAARTFFLRENPPPVCYNRRGS